MNLLTRSVLILSVLVAIEIFLVNGQYQANAEINVEPLAPSSTAEQPAAELPIVSQKSVDYQPGIYPKPSFIPVLRPYIIDKTHDIWHAQDPVSYIASDNEWIKYYASLLYIDYDGRIRYKNRPTPLIANAEGVVLSWTEEPFVNKYISDNEQFHYPPNGDMWVMPDYYLTHGMQDDCDGWMITVTSLMLSGEISIRDNGTFVKKLVHAKAVLGYVAGNRDGWVEYQVYGKTFITTTSSVNTGIDGTEKISATEFVERKNKTTAKPVFEFTDSYFGNYKAWNT